MAHTTENKEFGDHFYISNTSPSDHANRIIHIDEKIGSDEINIPITTESTENLIKDVDFRNINNVSYNLNDDSKNINTVRFDVDEKDKLNKNVENIKKEGKCNPNMNFNTNVDMLEQDTLSCIEEFDKIFKKYEHIHNYTTVLIPSLSETEELLKSINENDKNKLTIHSTNIAMPISTTSESNTIITNTEKDEKPVIHVDHNYVMDISRDNSTQLSANMNDESHTKDSITAESSKLTLSLKDEVKFEIKETINHDYLYDIDNNKEESDKISIISLSSDNIECDLELATSELNIIDTLSVNDDIISISSTENDTIHDKNDSDHCEGYNSSDFEFIDEIEAGLGGIIKARSKSKVHFKDFAKSFDKAGVSNRPYAHGHYSKYVSSKIHNDKSRNEIPYLHNVINTDESNNEHLNRHFGNENLQFSKDFGNNYIIPEDDNFLELFAQPWTVYQFEAENKAFYSSKTMDVEFDDIGFNVGVLQRRHEDIKIDDVYKKEAKDNAKKILSMYPFENKKRRRRF